jgi:dTDP-4-amino-4,6-dideoxygalactose transaminase
MPDWVVPLSDVRFTDGEVAAVAAVYRSGWLSQGPNVERFEAAMCEYLGVAHAVAVASGTAALHLACLAIGLKPDDEVVVPSLTFAATVSTVLQAGARPVFADISSVNRPWLSPQTVEQAIGPRTRAIVTVDYGGHPGDVLALRELADQRGLALVEDAAHALGARAGGAKAGTIGHVAAFSFFANKNLPLGEGGLLVTSDAELARRARLLRSHGLTADTWARHRGGHSDYDVLEPGYNYRLDEPRAALGTLLLERLDRDNGHRARLADAYGRALGEVDGVNSAIAAPDATSAWHIYPLLLDEGVDRAQFRSALRSSGVQTSIHYPPLHMTTAYLHAGRGPDSLPVTEEYGRRAVTVPLFSHMSEVQQAHVVGAIRGALTSET